MSGAKKQMIGDVSNVTVVLFCIVAGFSAIGFYRALAYNAWDSGWHGIAVAAFFAAVIWCFFATGNLSNRATEHNKTACEDETQEDETQSSIFWRGMCLRQIEASACQSRIIDLLQQRLARKDLTIAALNEALRKGETETKGQANGPRQAREPRAI